MINAANEKQGTFWDRVCLMGVVFIPSTFLHFIFSFLQSNDKYKNVIKGWYSLSVIFLFFNFTPFFARATEPKYVGQYVIARYFTVPGVVYYAFLIYFMSSVFFGVYLLFKKLKTASTKGYQRQQILYLLYAYVLGYIGGSLNYNLVLNIKPYTIVPFGNYLTGVYVVLIAYTIVAYRLMDIKLVITRTGIFIAVYTLVLGLPFAIAVWLKSLLIERFAANWWMLPLGLMAVLATLGPFIYIYINRRAEARLLREQRRYQDALKQASVGMTRIRNLRKLLDLITHIVTKTVRISYAAIYLRNPQTEEYVLQVCRDKGRIAIPKISPDNSLIMWILVKREPVIYEEVKRQVQNSGDATYKHLEENMRLLTASVVIPSFLEDRFMGFFVLGEKLSGQMYTPDDLNVFQVLASQSALAIENAQFYEEAKEMQEQIAQAEKMATIGTMADGLSHQINNRLHALSLIAGDSIDTIKTTNTSQCTPEVQEMIKQINHALERIQANVLQGGEVVRGILKYSRRQEESFEALTLDQVIDGTLEMVQYKVKLSEIDIIRDYPKDTPKIKANLAQLEEVFFNFIDNAYDAIVERRDFLKEANYRGRITVSAHPKDNTLEIIIEDNGIGIKDDNREKVFTPFFTTKVSSRRGTGLGLYVIRRIIADIHKGKINFESDYKLGTRFIVELPIAV
jgi:signal transduction histidine kinase